MRVSISKTVQSFAVLLTLMTCSAASLWAEEPGMDQFSDDSGGVMAASAQMPCEAAAPCAGQAPACQEPSEDPLGFFRQLCCPANCPALIFDGEVLGLQRSNARNQPLLLNRGGAALLNANSMDFPIEAGFRVGLIRRCQCGWEIEASYFQIDGWEVDRGTSGNFQQLVTDNNGDNFYVNNASTRYTSQLHFGEVNLRREWLEGLTLLAGFSMGELDELYTAGGAGAISIGSTVNLDARTFNHLYGFQVGGDWQFYNMGGPLTISAVCKAGVYDNEASQRIHYVDSSSSTSHATLETHRAQAAFLGQTGLVANYRLTKNLSFRASAEAVWLEGVALAPEQIGATNFATPAATTIDTHGSLFYYGGGMGFEFKF